MIFWYQRYLEKDGIFQMAHQKNLRLTPDQRLILDALRQYLLVPSDTEAGALSIITMGEQLLATYLANGVHPSRCDILLGALKAATGITPPPYKIDEHRRSFAGTLPLQPTSTSRPPPPPGFPWPDRTPGKPPAPSLPVRAG